MRYKTFVENATRTESVLDELSVNHDLFNDLQYAAINLGDCLDLLKKKAFYGKPIDDVRLKRSAYDAADRLTLMCSRIENNADYTSQEETSVLNARQFHGALGIFTESAELLELVDLSSKDLPRVDVADELGDGSWYTAILADSMELDMEEQVLVAVIEKLRTRFPDKFDSALAITRDKNQEKIVTEKSMGE